MSANAARKQTTPDRSNNYRQRVGMKKIPGLERGEITVRPCMCCGNKFQSEGKFNRLCMYCKESTSSSMG